MDRVREPQYADYIRPEVDVERLAVEWATIGLVGLGLVIWLGSGKDALDP